MKYAALIMIAALAWDAQHIVAQQPESHASRITDARQPDTPGLRIIRAQPTPAAARLAAQQAEERVSAVVTVGKWVTLGAAAASAAYGFSESRRADDLYDELERDCQARPDVCRERDDNGSYVHPDFEERYQDVLDIDRRTRQALFVSQASLLASAVLFVLDLRGDTSRPDIPYTPPALHVGPAPGDRLELRWRLHH